MTKTCTRCNTEKPLIDFYTRVNRGKIGAQGWCKSCQSAYYREKAKDNPRYFLDYQLRGRRSKTDRAAAIRAARGCRDCGENHPACLDFHHTDATTKDTEVRKLVERNARWSRIEAEIAKCVVLCSNCHRKIHWAERIDIRAATDERVKDTRPYVRKRRAATE